MYKISYVANGTQTEFSFAFPFFQTDDICVAINDIVDTENHNFSVMPNADFSGGNIVFDTPPAKDNKIDIFRQVSLSRVIDYQPTKIIDPEDLNSDFNFLLAALQDVRTIDIDLSQWANKHDDIKKLMEYTNQVIEDKMSGGTVLGLINDYGSITDAAPNENRDDYGIL
jgi:hypothetical protein